MFQFKIKFVKTKDLTSHDMKSVNTVLGTSIINNNNNNEAANTSNSFLQIL